MFSDPPNITLLSRAIQHYDSVPTNDTMEEKFIEITNSMDTQQTNESFRTRDSYDDDISVDSDFLPMTRTILDGSGRLSVKATLVSEKYDAATIRSEFKTYQSILPEPDQLLQEKYSFQMLRSMIEEKGVEVPRFLRYKFEKGIKPHHALCCLLLNEYENEEWKESGAERFKSWLVRILFLGYLHRQINNPAEFIRDQFYRVAHVIPIDVVKPSVLRKKIKHRGLPVPNYFLDPEDDKQFPSHIALLVILQDGEKESQKLNSILYRVAFSLFAFVALLLRMILEVVGGAGAIWGGTEVVAVRHADNKEPWRWVSIGVGVLCLLRFIIVNLPAQADEGDILGPAGPWSLQPAARLRAICEHPFHYFVRATPPFSEGRKRIKSKEILF